MIYLTGDTHIPIDIHKLNTKNFSEQSSLTDSDYVIICGDFGGVWDLGKEDLYWIKWLTSKNFTTLFVDGNHENHDLLNSNFDVLEFCSGKVHKITDKIYHLMRGELFTIENNTIFVMGGAESHDKEYRIEGKSWWADEMPLQDEYENANRNLERCNYNVDYVISHCTATSIQQRIVRDYPANQLTDYFEQLRNKLSYKKWYFGHYHVDRAMTDQDFAIYKDITLL